ncbi:MAG: hypothetical protein RI885_2534 [Actinomycetota bacterium]
MLVATAMLAAVLAPAAGQTAAAEGQTAAAGQAAGTAGPISAAGQTAAAAPPPVAWRPCGESAPGFDCATYTVPRDHAQPSGPTVDLALTRLPATDTENRIGSLFLNPGGPGGSGVAVAQGSGAFVSAVTDGRFDIVGFDPRGVAASTPIQCFTSDAERVGSGLFLDDIPDSPDEAVEVATASAAYTTLCGLRNPENLPYVSTEFVARDLDLLRAAVGDEQLSYLGLSYGTILGATYANLFPDRVRALALDGVVNPEDYTSDVTTALAGSVRDSDEVLEGFFETCETAEPELCALADKDPGAVYDRLLEDIRDNGGLPSLTSSVPTVLTEDFLTRFVFSLMYTPVAWPQLAAAIDTVAITGDGGAIVELAIAAAGPADPAAPYNNGSDARSAVWCTDSGDDGDADQWTRASRQVAKQSQRFGEYISYEVGLPCATWPVEAASRYAGPWDVPTANPVLLLSPTLDPITPLASAEELHGLLADSRLLVQESYGHTTLAPGQESSCTLGYLRAYLLEQELPADGTVCASDTTPFGQPTDDSGEPDGPESGLPDYLEDIPGYEEMRQQMTDEIVPGEVAPM